MIVWRLAREGLAVYIISIIVALLVCSITFAEQSRGDKLKVSTTFTVIADITKNVAGTAADVVSITKAGAEVHGYQPTPRDIVSVQDSDLILWNGFNLELWFENFFKKFQ